MDILKSFNECTDWMKKEFEAGDTVKVDEVKKYAKSMRETACTLSEQKIAQTPIDTFLPALRLVKLSKDDERALKFNVISALSFGYDFALESRPK
jgi:hypothetical protein